MLFLMRLLLLAGAASGIDPAPPVRLHLGWREVGGAPADEVEGASREVAALLAQAGVETAWSLGRDAAGDIQGDIVVIVIDDEPRGRPAVMGAAFAHASQAVWVFRRGVARALGLGRTPSSSWSRTDRAIVARALGRVAAHEVVHALTPGRPHDRGGLMAGALSRSFLMERHVALGSGLRVAIREGAGRLGGFPAQVVRGASEPTSVFERRPNAE